MHTSEDVACGTVMRLVTRSVTRLRVDQSQDPREFVGRDDVESVYPWDQMRRVCTLVGLGRIAGQGENISNLYLFLMLNLVGVGVVDSAKW
jgi:hypothetical protein